MYYELVERRNPLDKEAPKKLYATPCYTGRVGFKVLAQQIAAQTTLTPGDVSNVLKTFVDLFPLFMKLGNSVELEGFGTMRATFSSEGLENEQQFNPKMIRKLRVVFIASPQLRERLKEGLTFQKKPVPKKPDESKTEEEKTE